MTTGASVHLGSMSDYYLLQGEIPIFSKDIHMYDKRVELEYHRVLTFTPNPQIPTEQTLRFDYHCFFSHSFVLCSSSPSVHHRILLIYDIIYSNNPDEQLFFSLIEKLCWDATVQT
jgi:hypothetical protein